MEIKELEEMVRKLEKESPATQREFYGSLFMGMIRVLVWWPVLGMWYNIHFSVRTFLIKPWITGKMRYKYQRITGYIKYTLLYGLRK